VDRKYILSIANIKKGLVTMEQSFRLNNGQITFTEEKIVILDNEKKQYRTEIISSIGFALIGMLAILTFLGTGQQWLVWSWLFLTIAHVVLLILTLFRTTKNEIKYSEVVSIKLKQKLGHKFLDIKLIGNRIRRVTQIDCDYDELDELKQLIRINF
jgi:hypothetical protein